MMFPNFPQQIILDDLRQTRSVEVTIDNILENRLQPVSCQFCLFGFTIFMEEQCADFPSVRRLVN